MRRKPLTEGLPWTALHSMREYYTDRAPYHGDYMSWKGQQDLEVLLAPIVDVVYRELPDMGRWVLTLTTRP